MFLYGPLQATTELDVMIFSSNPAIEETILNVEPGAVNSCVALLYNGFAISTYSLL